MCPGGSRGRPNGSIRPTQASPVVCGIQRRSLYQLGTIPGPPVCCPANNHSISQPAVRRNPSSWLSGPVFPASTRHDVRQPAPEHPVWRFAANGADPSRGGFVNHADERQPPCAGLITACAAIRASAAPAKRGKEQAYSKQIRQKMQRVINVTQLAERLPGSRYARCNNTHRRPHPDLQHCSFTRCAPCRVRGIP